MPDEVVNVALWPRHKLDADAVMELDSTVCPKTVITSGVPDEI